MKVLDVVALVEDVAAHNLYRGHVGTLVDEWELGMFEVEFADTNGVAYAMVALRSEQLMVLSWQPREKQT